MKSRATPDFWSHYNRLPSSIQKSAKRAYARFRQNPNHPSLRSRRFTLPKKSIQYASQKTTVRLE